VKKKFNGRKKRLYNTMKVFANAGFFCGTFYFLGVVW